MTDKKKATGSGRNYWNIIFIFIPTILFFALITTIQMFILGDFIDYKHLTTFHITWILIFWLLCSVAFTGVTFYQINNWYNKPMQAFAKATNQVANGDFSVYVEPLHSGDRMDYLDYMFLDFNKMVEELGSIETLKTDFISNVSHELKTPLAVIQNYSEYLQQPGLTEEQKDEYAQTIEASAKRLAQLIANILKLNKLENQRIQPEFSQYNLGNQLANCIIQYEEIWDEKEIDIEADLEERTRIEADESLMEVVWNNIISNAIKFTERGGTIRVKQTSTPDAVTVSISDSGCGMDQETMRHIFDKFYQGDTSHSREGNGLGLALALRILQLHDGTIAIDSRPSEGSTFTVTLPIRDNMQKQFKKGDV